MTNFTHQACHTEVVKNSEKKVESEEDTNQDRSQDNDTGGYPPHPYGRSIAPGTKR